MSARRIATGTLLVASITIGGGSIAAAEPDGSRPAMDRLEVPCDDLAQRIDQLEHQLALLDAHRGRVQERLDAAVADGDAHRVARLQAKLRQVDRAAGRLQTRLDSVLDRWVEHCGPPEPT